MGGYGSGRWDRWERKTTIEHVQRLDIRDMRQRDLIRPGVVGSMPWQCGAHATGCIGVIAGQDQVVLYYGYRQDGGAWELVETTVGLEWTPCHHGNERPWFRCPECSRRVGVLCSEGTRLLCRPCARLPYASQQQTYQDRMRAQARKIRAQLGASTNLFEPVRPWHKPKGMHWRTFDQLVAREERYNHAALLALQAWLDKKGSFKTLPT